MSNEYNTVIIDNEAFDIFKNKLIKALTDIYGSSAEVKEVHTTKNNDVKLTGISICSKHKNMGPTVYLEDLYNWYEKGMTLGEIVRTIIKMVEAEEDNLDFDADDFIDYERASKRIVYRLVNTEKNAKMLEKVPHFEYLDMSIIFCYVVDSNSWKRSNMSGTIVLYNDHIKSWNKTAEDILEIAKMNTPEIYKADICHIGEIVDDMNNSMSGSMLTFSGDVSQVPLYVMSNKRRQYGAGVILYDDFLEEFSISNQHNFFLIPSSIHEMIAVIDNGYIDPESLKTMIYQVNRECLSDTEVLSDSLYYYDFSKRELRLV